MKTTWINWLLAGALLASMQWNLFRSPPGNTGPRTEAAPALDVESLGLTAEQGQALEELCRAECAQADRLEAQARDALGELHGALSEPEVDEAALREKVAEISALRQQSLHAMVDAVLEVRAVLAPEQVEVLLTTCCTQSCRADGETCLILDSTE